MTAQITRARAFRGRLSFTVWLDTSKSVPDPADAAKTIPDPAYVLSRDWPLPPGWAGRTAGNRTAILAGIRAELVAAAQEQLAALADEASGGTVLAIEGATF